MASFFKLLTPHRHADKISLCVHLALRAAGSGRFVFLSLIRPMINGKLEVPVFNTSAV
jgi:hypothetical protein